MSVKHFTKYWRFWLVMTGVLVLPVFLVVRASNLLVLENIDHGVSLKDEGDSRTIRVEELVAYRGLITDRNGELLAVSTPVKSIYADPPMVKQEQIPAIAKSLGVKESDFRAKLEDYKNKRFMYLKNQIPPHEADQIMSGGFTGIGSRTEYKRYYPAGEVTSHLLGITNIEEAGIEGGLA